MPTIVTLCGSTRFKDAFTQAQLNETLRGNIVLTIGCAMHSDKDIFAHLTPEQLEKTKERLDWLHFRKIDLSDEILVLNVDGYVGESTSREIAYAIETGKEVRWLLDRPENQQRENEFVYQWKRNPFYIRLTSAIPPLFPPHSV